MRVSISSDSPGDIAAEIPRWVRERGHEVRLHGALAPGADAQWAPASETCARDVAEGRADMAIVCCHTGTGATIAANKVRGVRAALCLDAYTAAGARKWNDANALGISLRLTSATQMQEILDAWFSSAPEASQAANVAHVNSLDAR